MDTTVVRITSIGGNAESHNQSDDIAWEHAKLVSQAVGAELGSEYFVDVFEHLRERYSDVGESFGFLHNLATRTLKEMMDLGAAITLNADASPEEVEYRFHQLIAVIFTAMAWTYASAPDGWISNDDWDGHTEDDRTVEFIVLRPSVTYKGNSEPEK